MTRTLPACTSCGSDAVRPFYSVSETPVTCTSIFDSPQEAMAVPMERVDLVVCQGCGLIFNAAFDPARAEIGARYESSQASSAHFSAFARSLAKSWVERHALAGRAVLEIGCGHGDFLRLLLREGVASAVGIDPLAAPESAPTTPGLRLHAGLFDAGTPDVRAAAAVCRHTLEHVHLVHDFLLALAAWARREPGRVVLLELPATERLITERAFWDVYYEHCNYFTAESLTRAVELAGFEVTRQERVYGDQYLILEGRIRRGDAPALPAPPEEWSTTCLRFGEDVRATVARCDRRLEAMAAQGGPIVLWQGAAKTVGFLASLGRRGLVHSAVDLSPQRQGRFLPGSGLPVHAPAELPRIAPKHVILMNPVYIDEVRAMLEGLGVHASLLTVNDLCAA